MTDNAPNGMAGAETLVGLLFILSIISERITNAAKLWMSDFNIIDGINTGNLKQRETDPRLEKLRERRILGWNLFFGFITAGIVQVSMLCVAANLNNPYSVIGWNNIGNVVDGPLNAFTLIIGWFFTACFISLGSKFWHDLLDLLFEVKNARNLVNQKTAADLNREQAQSAPNPFSALPATEQFDNIRTAIKSNYSAWRSQYPNITGASAGFKNQGKTQAIVLQVSQKLAGEQLQGQNIIPAAINYGGYAIPTDVIQASVTKPACKSSYPFQYPGIDNPRKPGGSLSRLDACATGTIGLKVFRTVNNVRKEYLLTCFHVLFDGIVPGTYNSVSAPMSNQVIAPGNICLPENTPDDEKTVVGNITWGMLNSGMDAAAVELNGPMPCTNEIYLRQAPTEMYLPTTDDAKNKITVIKVGMATSQTYGVLVNASSTQTIPYKTGNLDISDLLMLQLPVSEGDSGAALLDGLNRVIGIIIACDDQFSYAVPINYLKNNFYFEL